jgi:cardiolipin synthase
VVSREPLGSSVVVARDTRDGALLDQAFSRAAGAPLIAGNGVRLLKDGEDNYAAWLAALRQAKHKIYFENYFIVDDRTGREFAEALMERARAGVLVRLVYDWLGSFGKASRAFWRKLSDAGVHVRCFNPPRFVAPLDALHRDHRKVIAVDGHTGFVTGLCVGDMWRRDGAGWRDTGVEVRGPAVCDIERAFGKVWEACGGAPIANEEFTIAESVETAGDVSLRIVANEPGTTGIFRLDQLVAAAARSRLWLTDAYFAGVPPYVQALRAAAKDKVDVRLLVPGASDIPILRPLSQAGFRPLLEAGIRVFEWKGSMLHAKTAVADSRWARIGSSNLNVASWVGNYELDAVIEHEPTALAMEQMFLKDLENATEIVLKPRSRPWRPEIVGDREQRIRGGNREQRTRSGENASAGEHRGGEIGGAPRERDGQPGGVDRDGLPLSGASGSASRAAAGVLRVGRAVGAALTDQRVLAPTEARVVAIVGMLLAAIGIVGVFWPLVIAIPIAIVLLWMAISLFFRAHTLRMQRKSQGLPPTRVSRASSDQRP